MVCVCILVSSLWSLRGSTCTYESILVFNRECHLATDLNLLSNFYLTVMSIWASTECFWQTSWPVYQWSVLNLSFPEFCIYIFCMRDKVAPPCQKKFSSRETYSFLEYTGCWFDHYLQNYYWFSKLLGQQIDTVIYISRDMN